MTDYTDPSSTLAPSDIYRIDASTCQDVANVIWKDPSQNYNYFPSFQNTAAIRMAHWGVPRGRHSRNVLDVVYGTPEQAQDYVIGLFISSILILLLFGGWIIVLIVFKCRGRQKVGWVSGRRQPLPARPNNDPNNNNIDEADGAAEVVVATKEEEAAPNDTTDNPQKDDGDEEDNIASVMSDSVKNVVDQENAFENDDDNERDLKNASTPQSPPTPQTMDEWNDLYASKLKQQRWLKGVVVVSCLTVIVMAILMATTGVQSLRGSLSDGKVSINYAQTIVNAADQTVGQLALLLKTFQTDMQILLGGVNRICPRVRDKLCETLRDVNTCNTTGLLGNDNTIADQLGETFENLVRIFYQDWKIVTQLEGFQEDLRRVVYTTEVAEEQISTFDWIFAVAVVFNLLVGLLAMAMIMYLCFQQRRNSNHRTMPWFFRCMHHRCLFPTFVLFVLFSFIFAIAFLIASLVLSDTCADGPDQRIQAIADHYIQQDEFQPYIKEFLVHWLSRE